MKIVKRYLRWIFCILIIFSFILFTSKSISFQNVEITAKNMSVHFIDVDQGDSILIESNGHYMLVDAGDNEKGTNVVKYLKDQGINKLEYIIGTHPHSDHIGGLDNVINSCSVGKVILPDVAQTTQTFEDVLAAIEKKNLKITKPLVGDEYKIGDASFTIIAPNGSDYEDINDYSVGIIVTNGSNTFLMAGDAEVNSENDMIRNGRNLSAEVLKLSHHGSSYSTQNSFLDKVNPTYAVVSAGKENQYGHPHRKTLQKIYDRNIKLYRTDQQGTIIFTSDGKTITVTESNP